jgi:membrane associated rhomboid family serine protease
MILTSIALVALAAAGVRVLASRGRRPAIPWATILLAAVTTAISVAGELDDQLLSALDRNRDLFLDGQWWRIVTPLFVQDGGWLGTIVNLIALLIAGTLAEVLYSRWVMLAVYFLAGLGSEVAAYTVFPGQGFAGNSVAIVGLTALCLITIAVRETGLTRIIAIAGLVAGAVLLVMGDLHGAGFAIGLLSGVVLLVAGVGTSRKQAK